MAQTQRQIQCSAQRLHMLIQAYVLSKKNEGFQSSSSVGNIKLRMSGRILTLSGKRVQGITHSPGQHASQIPILQDKSPAHTG